nr:MAG TPA: hypothetical protein [Caudoviricetes sp.]
MYPNSWYFRNNAKILTFSVLSLYLHISIN